MSTNNHSVKKFCKVCHDAGKSEKEYTSHFVRSAPGPNSKVVCPTLLSLECRYCFKRGHTVKFCSTLLKSKTQTKTPATTPSKQQKESKEPTILPTNAFDVLLYESEDEDINEFPILGDVKEPVHTASSTFSYADALAKINKVTFEQAVIIPVIKATTTTTIRKKFSWADCGESSSDEEKETETQVEDNSAW